MFYILLPAPFQPLGVAHQGSVWQLLLPQTQKQVTLTKKDSNGRQKERSLFYLSSISCGWYFVIVIGCDLFCLDTCLYDMFWLVAPFDLNHLFYRWATSRSRSYGTCRQGRGLHRWVWQGTLDLENKYFKSNLVKNYSIILVECISGPLSLPVTGMSWF